MDWEYNLFKMCCRIYRSHPLTRVIEGLYILLATFLIGFFAVQGVSWIGFDRPPVQALPSLESIENRESELVVRHLGTRRYSDSSLLSIFRVTNTTSRYIYFPQEYEIDEMPGSDFVGREWMTEPPIEVTNRELGPGESGELWTALPDNMIDFTFRYRLDNQDRTRTVTLNIDQ